MTGIDGSCRSAPSAPASNARARPSLSLSSAVSAVVADTRRRGTHGVAPLAQRDLRDRVRRLAAQSRVRISQQLEQGGNRERAIAAPTVRQEVADALAHRAVLGRVQRLRELVDPRLRLDLVRDRPAVRDGRPQQAEDHRRAHVATRPGRRDLGPGPVVAPDRREGTDRIEAVRVRPQPALPAPGVAVAEDGLAVPDPLRPEACAGADAGHEHVEHLARHDRLDAPGDGVAQAHPHSRPHRRTASQERGVSVLAAAHEADLGEAIRLWSGIQHAAIVPSGASPSCHPFGVPYSRRAIGFPALCAPDVPAGRRAARALSYAPSPRRLTGAGGAAAPRGAERADRDGPASSDARACSGDPR